MIRALAKTFSTQSKKILLNNTAVSSSLNNKQLLKRYSTNSTTEVAPDKGEKVKVTFKLHDGTRIETEAKTGDTLLDVVVNNDLNIEGFGACEGTLTCSTCHVILKQEDYDGLPDEQMDEERDMLDLAYGLTDTSRLGCQITLTKQLDGLEVTVPETINDARS